MLVSADAAAMARKYNFASVDLRHTKILYKGEEVSSSQNTCLARLNALNIRNIMVVMARSERNSQNTLEWIDDDAASEKCLRNVNCSYSIHTSFYTALSSS